MPGPKDPERKASYERFAKIWWLLRIEARELRKVHREDLAEAIGQPSDQTGFIADIDNAKRIPEPANLDKLLTCMGLPYEDKALLFDLAGYRFSRPIPKLDSVRQELAPIIERHIKSPYPILVTDRRFAFWLMNPAATNLLGLSETHNPTNAVIKSLISHYHRQSQPRFLTVFDVLFNSALPLVSQLINADTFRRHQVARFKSLNRGEQHRRFYMAYPECMEKWLQPADYAYFRKVWAETDATDAAFEGKGKIHFQTGKAGTDVRMETVTMPVHSLDGFFEITYLDPETDQIQNVLNAHDYFISRHNEEENCLALWDVVPGDDLLRQYAQEYTERLQEHEIIARLEKRLKAAGIDVEKEHKKRAAGAGTAPLPAYS